MPTKPYPSQTQDRYIVRMPEGMRERIAEAAKANNRSMNAEIIARLEGTFARDEPAQEALVVTLVETGKVQNQIERLTGELGAYQQFTKPTAEQRQRMTVLSDEIHRLQLRLQWLRQHVDDRLRADR